MSMVQNGAFQGAIQGVFDGRGIQSLVPGPGLEPITATEAYGNQVAAANAFAAQVAAVFTAESVVITTNDEELLLIAICGAALEGRPLVNVTSVQVPNPFLEIATSIQELYSVAVLALT